LATSRTRIDQANKNPKEMLKFKKEHNMCLVFAKSGLRIKHFEDEKPDGSFDIVCNGQKGDLKRTKGSGNIVRYAKYATREQGAEIVLFEFEEWNSEFRKVIDELVRKDLHGFYFVREIEIVHRF